MIYSDKELERWWKGISKSEQVEILDRMIQYSFKPEVAISFRNQYEKGEAFTPKQLNAIRKWAR